jgi:hypothetical protein
MKSFITFLLGLAVLSAVARDLPVEVTPVELAFEAGASFHKDWSSGTTIHSGIGYLKPFGPASYSCGLDYDEAEDFPEPPGAHEWMLDKSIEDSAIFCVYSLAQGDIYAYDYLVGHSYIEPELNGRNSTVVNLVVGGTGPFENASGVWVGTTDGAGETIKVNERLAWPQSIMKLMDGYIRIVDD